MNSINFELKQKLRIRSTVEVFYFSSEFLALLQLRWPTALSKGGGVRGGAPEPLPSWKEPFLLKKDPVGVKQRLGDRWSFRRFEKIQFQSFHTAFTGDFELRMKYYF